MQQQTVSDSWLLVSTEGFRQQQAGREPALLVKELLQNSLDAEPTTIDFRIEHDGAEQSVRVVCCDDGEGVEDFDKMRCVFWTSKTDSHLKRGRMGRGFKDMLVVSHRVLVESNGRAIEFSRDVGNMWRDIKVGNWPLKLGTFYCVRGVFDRIHIGHRCRFKIR
jgi:Histidine kinase-, DNA gyrase B-, and HSP90-like ATPase